MAHVGSGSLRATVHLSSGDWGMTWYDDSVLVAPALHHVPPPWQLHIGRGIHLCHRRQFWSGEEQEREHGGYTCPNISYHFKANGEESIHNIILSHIRHKVFAQIIFAILTLFLKTAWDIPRKPLRIIPRRCCAGIAEQNACISFLLAK
jgi:hypothetical protein